MLSERKPVTPARRATRPFLWTLAVFLLVSGWSWFAHDWVLERWVSFLFAVNEEARTYVWTRAYPEAYHKLHIAIATATLATFPVFHAEAWRHICRLRKAEHALCFTLPFAACTAGIALFMLWLATAGFTVRFFW